MVVFMVLVLLLVDEPGAGMNLSFGMAKLDWKRPWKRF
jgi:hypothetical protein